MENTFFQYILVLFGAEAVHCGRVHKKQHLTDLKTGYVYVDKLDTHLTSTILAWTGGTQYNNPANLFSNHINCRNYFN